MFNDHLDLSYLDANDIQEIEERFYQISNTYEPENIGVIRDGLNLLIAYCLIIIDLHLTTK